MKQLEETGKQGSPLNGTEEGERLDPWLSDTGRGRWAKCPRHSGFSEARLRPQPAASSHHSAPPPQAMQNTGKR